MSRSNNTDIVSPVKRYFEWSSEHGSFKYYDKEEKKNVPVPLPFRFMVLDQLNSIGGFSDSAQSSFWSNDVRDMRTEVLTVRTKDGLVASGVYEKIKDRIKAEGAKYAKTVFIAYYDADKHLYIGSIKFIGSSVSAWIDWSKGKDVMQGAVEVSTFIEEKKGATRYKVPVFKTITAGPDAEGIAMDLDVELQQYLKAYFEKSKQVASEAVAETEAKAPQQTGYTYPETNRSSTLPAPHYDAPMPDHDDMPAEEEPDYSDLPF